MDDDLQFNASLDALLESESAGVGINAATANQYFDLNNIGNNSSVATQQQHLGEPNQSGQLQLSQGLLTDVARGTTESMLPPSVTSHPTLAPPSFSLGPGGVPSARPMIAQRGITFETAATISSAPAFDSTSQSNDAEKKPPAAAKKRARDVSEVSEDEDDNTKRRSERNLREQQRSHRITQQIAELREVLTAADIQFKPDKYSTLVTVGDYIKDLQARSSILDSEHKKLVNTIAMTNEMANNSYATTSPSIAPDEAQSSTDPLLSGFTDSATSGGDTENAQIQSDIDYKSIFANCGIPLAVASIDGRFMDFNKEFEALTGFSKNELLSQGPENQAPEATASVGNAGQSLSLFNLLRQEDMESVFKAMSDMLRQPGEQDIGHVGTTLPTSGVDRWSGIIYLSRKPEQKIRMNIALIRSPRGRARFFDCSLTVDKTI